MLLSIRKAKENRPLIFTALVADQHIVEETVRAAIYNYQ